ncbi:MAG: hypothetical protein ACEQSH_00260 [Bacteroidia bacterium]
MSDHIPDASKMVPRCEPPEELRGVDGWHAIEQMNGKRTYAAWHAHKGGWNWLGGFRSPEEGAEHGWRYIAPVTPPAEVATLRAKADAHDAVAAERDRLREALEEIAKKTEMQWEWVGRYLLPRARATHAAAIAIDGLVAARAALKDPQA